MAITVPLAAAKAAFIAFAAGDLLNARPVQSIGTEFAGLNDSGVGKRPPYTRALEAAHDEIAFRPFDARLLAHAKAGRLAVAPLAGVAHVVGQPHRAEAVQLIGLPSARLAFAVGQVGDAETLTLAVDDLPDVARPRIVRQALGVLEVWPAGPRRHDARLAGRRARGARGFLGARERRARFGGSPPGLLDDRLLSRRIRRRRGRLRLDRRRRCGKLRGG